MDNVVLLSSIFWLGSNRLLSDQNKVCIMDHSSTAEACKTHPTKSAWRWPLSALLLLHLAAVFSSPFAFICSSSDSTSPAASAMAGVLRPYVDMMFLNHGYAFFAPNPGPSHLVRYTVDFEGDQPPVQRTFPDIRQHWPRLLYHRHFMLSEQLQADAVPADPPPTDDEMVVRQWRRRREIYEAKLISFEKHLRNKYDSDRVTLVRVEHRQPAWSDVLMNGKRLDASDLYFELPDDRNTSDENDLESLPNLGQQES